MIPAAVIARVLSTLGGGVARGTMFGIRMSAKSVRNLRVALDMRARAKAVKRMNDFVLADQTYRGVVERIPSGPKWKQYRNSITLARLGSQKNAKSYLVYAKPSAQNREFDAARTVLYVRPKKSFMGKIPKEVLVLAKYSPWTAETLPFSPRKNEATIVTRKATKREMQSVSKQREKDQPTWHKELSDAGVRSINLNKKPPELKTKVVQDLAFDALRLELGYGGTQASPHWRPAVKDAMRFTKKLFKARRGIYMKAMTDPKYVAWKKWPPRVESSIKIGTLKSVQKFSKRLRIRF